jgi:hypothetical protein
VAILGPDVVTQKVMEANQERQVAEMNQNKAQVQQLLDQGILVKAEKVSERSLLVGQETTKGTEEKPAEVIFPGRQQLMFGQIRPDLKDKVLGATVGFQIDTPAGNVFTLQEIYDVTEKKADPAPTPTAEETAPTGAQ